MGWADRPRPILAHLVASFLGDASHVFYNVLPSACGPLRQFLCSLDEAPYPARSSIFCSGPLSFSSSRVDPWASWSHVHFIA
jgi:hypothetical protein